MSRPAPDANGLALYQASLWLNNLSREDSQGNGDANSHNKRCRASAADPSLKDPEQDVRSSMTLLLNACDHLLGLSHDHAQYTTTDHEEGEEDERREGSSSSYGGSYSHSSPDQSLVQGQVQSHKSLLKTKKSKQRERGMSIDSLYSTHSSHSVDHSTTEHSHTDHSHSHGDFIHSDDDHSHSGTHSSNDDHHMTLDKNSINDRGQSGSNGRWTSAEHSRFVQALRQYGREWDKVQRVVKTRSLAQIRSHAQKYFIKVCKTEEMERFSGVLGMDTMSGEGRTDEPRERGESEGGKSEATQLLLPGPVEEKWDGVQVVGLMKTVLEQLKVKRSNLSLYAPTAVATEPSRSTDSVDPQPGAL